MYNCTASRPSIASQTNEEKREVRTEKLSIKARPLPDGNVKARTGKDTSAAVYNGWYDNVYLGAAPAASGSGSGSQGG